MSRKLIMFCTLILILNTLTCLHSLNQFVDPLKTLVWGPGIKPDVITLPARYFFIQPIDIDGNKFINESPLQFIFNIEGDSSNGKCRFSYNYINRNDGTILIRYKIFDVCQNVKLELKYNGTHIANSPYIIYGNVYSEKCYCPRKFADWFHDYECPREEKRIQMDLQPFKKVNFSLIRDNLIKTYYTPGPGSLSLCHYMVKKQNIYRKCYGKSTSYKVLMDETLLSMVRIVELPDFEFFLNINDSPLAKKDDQQRTTLYPIFSWCGSEDTFDIVLPTYDITESTIENMGRVKIDMLSVQKMEYLWEEKEDKAFFQGRDSNRERLNLIDLSRKYPNLINASLTNFFFFGEEEEIYGPIVSHISLAEYFKYKYQINIDGSVAAYRMPYLLGGDSLVLKQDSPFYEHFYDKLKPSKHYIAFKRDLSDLITKIVWAKENDSRAKEISIAARKFIEENLLPVNIYCYHALLFQEWSKRLVSPIIILPGMEKIEQNVKCACKVRSHLNLKRDEL